MTSFDVDGANKIPLLCDRLFFQNFGDVKELHQRPGNVDSCPVKGQEQKAPDSVLPKETGMSEIKHSDELFCITLDLHDFQRENITITLTWNGTLVVRASHPQKQDEYGFVRRLLIRQYSLPWNMDRGTLVAIFDKDTGLLEISVQKQARCKEVEIPVWPSFYHESERPF